VLKSFLSRKYDAEVVVDDGQQDWGDYKSIYLTEGVSFREGKFNLFGGVSLELIERLKKFPRLRPRMKFVDSIVQEPRYYSLVENRKELRHVLSGGFFPYEPLSLVPTWQSFSHGLDPFDRIIIGDSHAISVYRPGSLIRRIDGATLSGVLSRGLKNCIPCLPSSVKHLTLYFGNIDVRFHLHRDLFGFSETYLENAEDLCYELESQLGHVFRLYGFKTIEIVAPLPIESESRRIPQSGQYKNSSYFGSLSERQEIVDLITIKMITMQASFPWLSVRTWDHLRREDKNLLGEKPLDQSCMEARQSVHLAPHSYPFLDQLV
jgi:hypothetical protein